MTPVGSRSIPGKKRARIDPHVYDCWFEGGAPILGVKSEGHTDASPPVPSMQSVSRSALKQGDYGSPFGEPSATGGGEVASAGCLFRKRFVRVRAASSLDCCSLAPHLIGEGSGGQRLKMRFAAWLARETIPPRQSDAISS